MIFGRILSTKQSQTLCTLSKFPPNLKIDDPTSSSVHRNWRSWENFGRDNEKRRVILDELSRTCCTSISKSRNCLALAIAPKSKHKIEDCFEGSMPTFIFFLFKVDPLTSFYLQVCLFLAVQ